MPEALKPTATKDYPRISRGTPNAARFTGNPTGNKPRLTSFPQTGVAASPLDEPLRESSTEAMRNRMAVYHSQGGPKGADPRGDYVAPDGKRSHTLPEHLAHVLNHVPKAALRDARSGETFQTPQAALAHKVATRHKKGPGAFAKATADR